MWNTLLSLTLAFGLALSGCSPAPSDGTSPSSAPQEAELAGFLAELRADQIGFISWYGPNEAPSPAQVAGLLSEGAGQVIEHGGLTVYDSADSVLWSMDVYIAPAGQGAYSGDDALHLWAGLEENVVEVSAGANLPAGSICLDAPALYQLLRTSCDTPDDIDQQAYTACKALTDAYYDARLAQSAEAGCGFSGWELTQFREVEGAPALNARAYRISAAFLTDFSQRAVPFQAGGMYVDSALRAHGLDWKLVYVVTVDGAPAGVLRRSLEELSAQEDAPLAGFASREALYAALWTPGEEL